LREVGSLLRAEDRRVDGVSPTVCPKHAPIVRREPCDERIRA
jgi:hypothetical protein